ncbi:MAG: flotillin-like FloA family protein, partial [Culicoidibacterales bacterium]
MELTGLVLIIPFAIVFLILFVILLTIIPVGLWITARFSNVQVPISTLIGMRFRRVAPARIINPLIKATKAGLDLEIDKLEAHYLAGGNIDTVINA